MWLFTSVLFNHMMNEYIINEMRVFGGEYSRVWREKTGGEISQANLNGFWSVYDTPSPHSYDDNFKFMPGKHEYPFSSMIPKWAPPYLAAEDIQLATLLKLAWWFSLERTNKVLELKSHWRPVHLKCLRRSLATLSLSKLISTFPTASIVVIFDSAARST